MYLEYGTVTLVIIQTPTVSQKASNQKASGAVSLQGLFTQLFETVTSGAGGFFEGRVLGTHGLKIQPRPHGSLHLEFHGAFNLLDQTRRGQD